MLETNQNSENQNIKPIDEHTFDYARNKRYGNSERYSYQEGEDYKKSIRNGILKLPLFQKDFSYQDIRKIINKSSKIAPYSVRINFPDGNPDPMMTHNAIFADLAKEEFYGNNSIGINAYMEFLRCLKEEYKYTEILKDDSDVQKMFALIPDREGFYDDYNHTNFSERVGQEYR